MYSNKYYLIRDFYKEFLYISSQLIEIMLNKIEDKSNILARNYRKFKEKKNI